MGRSASFIHEEKGSDVSIHLPGRGRSVAALFVVLLITPGVAACSGSAPTPPTGGSPDSATPPPGASSTPVILAGAGGIDAHYCTEMKLADAQALVMVPIAAAQTGGPETCAFVLPGEDINGDNMTVTVFPGDSDKQYYNDSVTGPASGPQNPLPGVGDVAVWEQVTGGSAPFVAAQKGSLTCVVLPPGDTSRLTIDQTGSGPIYQISNAAAAAYAVKEAVLCSDLFAAGS